MQINESEKLKDFQKKFLKIAKSHPLYKNILETNGNIVFGRGSDTPKIVFIGEAPGQNENKIGLPFIGRSGKLLDTWIKYLKLNENDFCIINVVPIIPFNKDKQIRPPTKKEIEYFLPLTQEYLEILSPKIVILLGKSAASIFDSDIKLGEIKNYKNFKIFFIYHPSYYLRNGGKGFENTLKELKIFLEKN